MPGLAHRHDPGTLAVFLDWVDERFGPVRSLRGICLTPPDPQWWIYTCDLARAPVGNWYSPYPIGAAGASTRPEIALQRAIGEAVERYSGLNALGVTETLQLPLKDSAVAGSFPACHQQERCPAFFYAPDLESTVTQVLMKGLSDAREIFVPAAHVLLGFSPDPPEPLVSLPISTGLAYHSEIHQAIWAGLCEVAERDAMMLMWWARREVRAIDCCPSDIPEPLADRLQRLARVSLSPHLFDITTDFKVPTVFCVVTGGDYPYFVVGAATRSDPMEACTKAIDEAVSVRVSVRGRTFSEGLPSFENFEWVQSLDSHALLYAAWENTPALDFLLNGCRELVSFEAFAKEPWWKTPTSMTELSLFASRLLDQDLTVLWTDLTAPEASGQGHVVKVVVPQMVPLSQDHNVRWLGTPRLARALDLTTCDISVFNRYPHPFA